MKMLLINIIVAVVLAANISGCATVCNPANPQAAIQSGNPMGMAVGLGQFGACGAYYLVKKAMGPDEPAQVGYKNVYLPGQDPDLKKKTPASTQQVEQATETQPASPAETSQ